MSGRPDTDCGTELSSRFTCVWMTLVHRSPRLCSCRRDDRGRGPTGGFVTTPMVECRGMGEAQGPGPPRRQAVGAGCGGHAPRLRPHLPHLLQSPDQPLRRLRIVRPAAAGGLPRAAPHPASLLHRPAPWSEAASSPSGPSLSTNKVAAVVAMAVVGFGVLFAGIVSPQAATGATAALLLFVLPVAVAQPASAVGPRLVGWAGRRRSSAFPPAC